MAGLGWKAWTTETVSSTEMQGYLQDQAVMRFASVSARNAVLTSPTDGMVTYLEDVDRLEYREGGAYWRPLDAVWPTHTSGALPSTGTKNGDLIYSSVYQCCLVVANGVWRQASIVQVTNLNTYAASLTAAGITSVHNGFLVIDTNNNEIWAGVGALSFMRTSGTMTARVISGFPTTGVTGWSYVAGGTTWVRNVGGGMAQLYLVVQKSGSTQNVDITGEMTNVTVGNVPTAYQPIEAVTLVSGGTGRVAAGVLNTDGTIVLAAVSPGAGIVAGDQISLGGTYRLASNQVTY
jgi:hypothetical protein